MCTEIYLFEFVPEQVYFDTNVGPFYVEENVQIDFIKDHSIDDNQ